MNTIQTQSRFIEWLSADEMHDASKKWLSELQFIADEHLFFQDLIKTYTLQLIEDKAFNDNKEIINVLNRSQKRNNELIEAVKTHESDLKIMVDDIDQLKEEDAYKAEHRGLTKIISNFYIEYTEAKTQLFKIIKNVIKKGKQERLIDRK